MTPKTIQEIVNAGYQDFTDQQKKIAEYLIGHPEEAAFLSIADLAAKTGTSGATITRFCRQLGFNGFNELKESFQKEVWRRASTAGKFLSTLDQLDNTQPILGSIIEREILNLTRLQTTISEQQLLNIAAMVIGSDRLVIFGEGPMASVGSLAEYRLRRFGIATLRIFETGKDLFDKAMDIRPGDCLLLFNFLRFSEETEVLLTVAARQGAKTVLVTDLQLSAITRQVDEYLQVSRGSGQFFQSLVTPVLVMEAIILVIGKQLGPQAAERLVALEKFRKIYGYPRLGSETRLERESEKDGADGKGEG